MRKTIKIIRAATIMVLLLIGMYLSRTTQARIIKEDKTNDLLVEKVKYNIDFIFDTCKYNNNILDDDIVDMQKVVDYDMTEYGLMIYFNDGTGYFIER